MDSIIQNAFEKTFGSAPKQTSLAGAPTGMDAQAINEQFGLDMHQARILVIGCGGGGCNTVNTLTEMGVAGASTISINTDARHLASVKAHKKILIGKELTRGLGAGGYPEVGRKAAEESRREIKEALEGCDMLFITAGLGGGTGSGCAPVVAEIAKQMGAIVIATVTMPFRMEGTRINKAEDSLGRLRAAADTVIVIENEKLLQYAGDLPIKQAFAVADELVSTMIKGLTETITQPSLVNLDYADVKAVMHSGGVALIGIGEDDSGARATQAVSKALKHPLLEADIAGGNGAIVQVIGGEDLKLEEINTIGQYVSKHLNPEAQVIWGARVLPEFNGRVQVITIVTGVKSPYVLGRAETSESTSVGYSDSLGIPMIR